MVGASNASDGHAGPQMPRSLGLTMEPIELTLHLPGKFFDSARYGVFRELFEKVARQLIDPASLRNLGIAPVFVLHANLGGSCFR